MEKPFRLLEETVIEAEVDGPKVWKVTWRNIDTGGDLARRIAAEEFEATLAPLSGRPLAEKRWSLKEVESIGEPFAADN